MRQPHFYTFYITSPSAFVKYGLLKSGHILPDRELCQFIIFYNKVMSSYSHIIILCVYLYLIYYLHKLCRFYLSPFFLERIYTSSVIVSKMLLPSVTALGTFSSSVTVSNINSQSDSSAVIGLGVRMVILYTFPCFNSWSSNSYLSP